MFKEGWDKKIPADPSFPGFVCSAPRDWENEWGRGVGFLGLAREDGIDGMCTGSGASPGSWPLQGVQAQGRSRGGGLRLRRTEDSRTQEPTGGSGSQTQEVLMLIFQPVSRMKA